jgi:putative ABC transport system permease protein
MKSINEYRIYSGICELMELQLVEGTFYREDDPTNEKTIILNEAAVKDLGLHDPVVGTTVDYKGLKEIRGVVKDFYYDKIENPIGPMVLQYTDGGSVIYVKYADNIPRNEVEQTIREVLKNVDSAYILSPIWLEDVYMEKFDNLNIQSRLLLLASILSIFISAIGLLAMHMLSTVRRKKEVGIRRINGASYESIFMLLSVNILKWIVIAGIIAIPVIFYFASDWLNNYANRSPLGISVFILPVLLQCIITLLVTSGVTIKALSQNPADVLKTE